MSKKTAKNSYAIAICTWDDWDKRWMCIEELPSLGSKKKNADWIKWYNSSYNKKVRRQNGCEYRALLCPICHKRKSKLNGDCARQDRYLSL
jgi:hypothetical protein